MHNWTCVSNSYKYVTTTTDVLNSAHLLQGSLRAERGQIRAYKTVALMGHLFQVNVITQLHVLCVDTKDFKAT